MTTHSRLLQTAAKALPNPLEGRTIITPKWEVEVTPGGEKAIVEGTVQQVRSEMLKRNPNWDTDFAVVKREPEAQPKVSDLTKRTDFSNSKTICGGRWEYTDLSAINDGIDYLRGVGGRPLAGPGPGFCARVSCSYDAAIYWCNDAPEDKRLESFGSIADGTQKIVDECATVSFGGPMVAGQVFHSTDWNVIVRRDGC
ncbi:hypothetical protein BDV18DRAFT_78264 [Aspergillus unguis]